MSTQCSDTPKETVHFRNGLYQDLLDQMHEGEPICHENYVVLDKMKLLKIDEKHIQKGTEQFRLDLKKFTDGAYLHDDLKIYLEKITTQSFTFMYTATSEDKVDGKIFKTIDKGRVRCACEFVEN